VRVRALLGVSLDGFGTGDGQSAEAPFGHAGQRLLQWLIDTRTFAGLHLQTGLHDDTQGATGIDDDVAARSWEGVGVEIMGAGKFGPPGWQDDPDWRGWWGENPPFHTPVFVLTHHPRGSLEMEGGTTFHFRDASPQEALDEAAAAAGGLDVRIGGGPTTVREFLAAGLIDELHVAVVPIVLGRGVRLWDELEGIEQGYDVEAVASPSGVTHVTFTRAAQ
jgi:dihydrofolate reductase